MYYDDYDVPREALNSCNAIETNHTRILELGPNARTFIVERNAWEMSTPRSHMKWLILLTLVVERIERLVRIIRLS